MNTVPGGVLNTDYSTLLTKDPGTFFEAIIINILWDKDLKQFNQDLINKQKAIFLKWLKFYTNSIKEENKPEVVNTTKVYNQGQLDALSNLPMKGKLTKTVDLKQINTKIEFLNRWVNEHELVN